MSKNTGGPAFPSGVVRKTRQRPNDPGSDFIISDTVEAKNPGLTLRDYIAIHASDEDVKVQANVLRVRQELGILPDGWNVTARYMHADAMLKEREK